MTPDLVNHPPHYTGKVECIDGLEALLGPEGFIGYCRGNCVKYLWRWSSKHPKGSINFMQDLHKARWYLDRLIQTASMWENSDALEP